MLVCKNINEVRENIDRIDSEIVKLIAERGSFVKQAAKFKTDSEDVKDTKRCELVIEKVKKLAEEHQISQELVAGVYRKMIASFIELEMNEFSGKIK